MASPPLPDPGQATSLHLRRAVDGDDEAASWLISRLNPLLLAQAEWRLGPRLRRVCDPADLVHEAWLVLLPKLPDIPPRDGRLTPVLLSFLSTTILHKTQNLLRREARRSMRSDGNGDAPMFDLAGPRSEVISAVVRNERACNVREALDELPEQDREILLMRAIEQQPAEDVAERFGLSRDTMYKRYSRALGRLRQQLPESVFAELQDA